jgi:hypothetical protein
MSNSGRYAGRVGEITREEIEEYEGRSCKTA